MKGFLATLGRHQVGALAATGVDFGLMALLVETGVVRPVPATAIGAACGALTNFALSRAWVFQSAYQATIRRQVWRYALVSLASLGWNTLGEKILYGKLGLPYFGARVIVAIVVSVAWNFPLHRYFVFRPLEPSP